MTRYRAAASIAGCVAVAFCEGFDLQAAGVAAGGIVQELRPAPEQLGTFFSASTLGLLLGALIGGRLSDSVGRKRILIASIALFGLFSMLTAAAPDVATLAWARLATGAGLGGAFPNLLALVSESSGPRRRSANVALAYSAMPFGGSVVSLMSMLSVPEHWRWIFVAGGAMPLILAPILHWAVQESPEFRRSAAAVQVEASGPKRNVGYLAIFAAGRGLATVLLWISSFLELLILYLILSWLPLLLMGAGLGKTEAAGVQIAFNLGGAFAALGIGQLLEGRARNPGIVAALLAVPLFVLLLSHAPSHLALLTLIVFGLGCAVLAVQSFLYATAPRCYPTLIRGVAMGAAVAMGRTGSIVGPKLGGALKAAGHGSWQLFADLLPLAVLASATGLWFAWWAARLQAREREAHVVAR